MTRAIAASNTSGSEDDLHLLALRAARQIDLAHRGKDYNMREVEALMECLDSGAESFGFSAARVKDLAPADIGVMTRGGHHERREQQSARLPEDRDAPEHRWVFRCWDSS